MALVTCSIAKQITPLLVDSAPDCKDWHLIVKILMCTSKAGKTTSIQTFFRDQRNNFLSRKKYFSKLYFYTSFQYIVWRKLFVPTKMSSNYFDDDYSETENVDEEASYSPESEPADCTICRGLKAEVRTRSRRRRSSRRKGRKSRSRSRRRRRR